MKCSILSGKAYFPGVRATNTTSTIECGDEGKYKCIAECSGLLFCSERCQLAEHITSRGQRHCF